MLVLEATLNKDKVPITARMATSTNGEVHVDYQYRAIKSLCTVKENLISREIKSTVEALLETELLNMVERLLDGTSRFTTDSSTFD